MPGSSRLNGQPFVVRVGGVVTPNIGTSATLTVYANYPSGQYPVANITNAVGNTTGGANIALYNANNNFVVGQYVTVANVSSALDGTVGPLVVANSTAFAGQVGGANVGNAAAITLTNTAAATIAPQPFFVQTGPALTNTANAAGGPAPFTHEIRGLVDQTSGLMVCYGIGTWVNTNTPNNGPNVLPVTSTAGVGWGVPGVNTKLEPPVTFTAAITFNTGSLANAATLESFYLES